MWKIQRLAHKQYSITMEDSMKDPIFYKATTLQQLCVMGEGEIT
jgi:hypothetical protein